MTWMLPTCNTQSTLLGLPAELRERIFEFAVYSEKPLVTFHIDDYQREVYEEAIQPALLGVSRQVRQEALPLFYRCNDFIFFTEGKKAEEAQHWLGYAQPYLDTIGGAVFWLRHISRSPSRLGPNGAISVTMRYAARQQRWIVCSEWRWISPVRKPDDMVQDARYLTETLQDLISQETRVLTADFLVTLMSTLRKSYIDHKVH